MLNLGKKNIFLLLSILLVSCTHNTHKEKLFSFKSKQIIGENEYSLTFNKLKDSMNIWVLNKLRRFEAEAIYKFQMDSLLCFNSNKDRFISCRHLYVNIPDATSDDLQFIYGEKINGGWYFFKGESIAVPREVVENHNIYEPLSYQQLHEVALKEVYSGYLNSKGEINEEWFTLHFENVGWCSKCKTSEDFRKSRIEGIGINWLNRDTTKPILQLP